MAHRITTLITSDTLPLKSGMTSKPTTKKHYENQKTKQASQNRQARGECVHRILEHHHRRLTASGINHHALPITMNQELKEKLQAEADPELQSNDLMDKGRAELALELLRWLEEQES
jgi:ATP-dependent helicase/DNAse subunit B